MKAITHAPSLHGASPGCDVSPTDLGQTNADSVRRRPEGGATMSLLSPWFYGRRLHVDLSRLLLDVRRNTIQPFPSFSEIHAAALKGPRREIVAARQPAGA